MKIVECSQYDSLWWQARRGTPTASEFGSLITAVKGEPSKGMMTYICQLIADRYSPWYGPSVEGTTAAMRNGTETEPEARRTYTMMTDNQVREVGFCLTDDGRFGCSPDGLIGDTGCLELKCPQPHTMVAWLLDGKLPDDHKQQVHGHLAVTGCQWCDFFAYSPGLPPLLVRVEPNDYTEKVKAAMDQFWTLYQDTLSKLELGAPPVDENAELADADHPW